MNKGYIKTWRKAVDNELYFSEPFTKWQAWHDLLLMANYKPRHVSVRGILVEIKAGEVLACERHLSERWRWSRGKVRRFIDYLSSETVQQIVPQKNNVTTVISIVNWNRYQNDSTPDNTTDSTTDGPQTVPQTVPQTDLLKNIENIENEKNGKKTRKKRCPLITFGEYGHIKLTKEEHNSLIEKHGDVKATKAISFLDEKIELKGYKYKNDYLLFNEKSWIWEAMINAQKKEGVDPKDVNNFF